MIDDVNKNKDQQSEIESEKEIEKELESEQEAEMKLQLSKEDVEEILMELAVDPEAEVSRETLAAILRRMSEESELVEMQEFLQMTKLSGEALANKDKIMDDIRGHVALIREQFPGYEPFDWMTIFSDIEQSHVLTTVVHEEIQTEESFEMAWIRNSDRKEFRKAEPEEQPEDSGNDYLMICGNAKCMYVYYYSKGEFFEEPVLLVRGKNASEDETFSILLDAGRRSILTGGMMPYRGKCNKMDAGIYEIKFMTNYKKIDENGRIICE